jgi:signal peptide peptidase SppA
MSTTEHQQIDEGAHGRPSHSHAYPALDKWFTETPWAIRPEMLAVLQEIRKVRLSGHRFSAEEIEQRIGAARGDRPSGRSGAIAVVPLYGVIVPRATAMTQMSGGMTLQDFRGMLREAVSDPDVSAILIDVDSPGGSVDQVAETADEVRDAAARKPLWAIANTDCYSAAYWIASQASELWVTPSGGVGSVGVYAGHVDYSGQLEQDGVQVTLIQYGDRKTDGNPYQPLSAEALAGIQSDVDTFGEMFVAAVAKGRGVKTSVVKSDYGQGAIVLARAAVAAGMADKVGTFGQAVQELARASSRSTGSATASAEFTGIAGGTSTNTTMTASLDSTSFIASLEASEDHEPAPAATVEPVDEPPPARSVEDMHTILRGGSR